MGRWTAIALFVWATPQAVADDEVPMSAAWNPRCALSPMFYELPADVGLTYAPIRKELRLSITEDRALDQELAAREQRIGSLVQLLEDPKVTVLDRGLRLRAVASDPAYSLEAHRARLVVALGAGAKRWEELQRQLEGPLSAFHEPRRLALKLDDEQWRKVQAQLPKWRARVKAVMTPRSARPGDDPYADYHRFLAEKAALARDIEGWFTESQKVAWSASLGKPFSFEGLAVFAGRAMSAPPKVWGDLEDEGRLSTVRSRPLQLASLRAWLQLTPEEEARVEETETASEGHVEALKDICGGCAPREAGRIREAWRRGRMVHLVHDRQVWAVIDPAKAQKAQAIFYLHASIATLTWPGLREEFGIDKADSPGYAAYRQGYAEVDAEVRQRAENRLRPWSTAEFVQKREDHTLALLPKHLAARWRELTKLDPPLPAALAAEYHDFIAYARPRQPYVPKAPPKQ